MISSPSTKPTQWIFFMAMQEVWTLCRILKRIPTYKKYVPAVPAIKQNPISYDSNSKTCSFESDQTSSEQYVSFGDSFVQQNESKPVVIDQVDHGRDHFFMGGQYDSITEAPFTAACQNFWNPDIGDDFFANGNWDELRPVVQLAFDPTQVYDYCR
ncbi:unnamed protein product [Dovyalis caffra]|uniref:Uncharacterized protein n=1 Tax=Dovyalis caffra TaxID=77055 RepID=A0AAV1S5F6_9ROSI|nr:unnamed protein product [Dovyalis caffra]